MCPQMGEGLTAREGRERKKLPTFGRNGSRLRRLETFDAAVPTDGKTSHGFGSEPPSGSVGFARARKHFRRFNVMEPFMNRSLTAMEYWRKGMLDCWGELISGVVA